MLEFTWDANAFAAVLNGGSEVTNSSGTVPSGLTTLRHGSDTTGHYWNGLIARETIYASTRSTATWQSDTTTWPGTSFAVESYDFLQRSGIATSTTRAAAYDTLIKSLKSAGVWSKLDTLYLLAGADTWEARRNLKQNIYNLKLGAAATVPAFTADRGFTGDATSAYLQSSFDATASGVNWTQDSASIFVWDLTSRVGVASSTLGQANSRIQPLNASGNVAIRVNDIGSGAFANPGNSTGFYLANRTGSTATRVKRNDTLLGTSATASIALSSSNFRILSNTSQFTGDQIAVAGWGSSLSTGEETALYNALSTYLSGVGAI